MTDLRTHLLHAADTLGFKVVFSTTRLAEQYVSDTHIQALSGQGATLPDDARGVTDTPTRTIVIRDDIARDEQDRTLAHEVAHAQLRADGVLSTRWTYPVEEMLAEQTGEALTKLYGENDPHGSAEYVRGWHADRPDVDVADTRAMASGLADEIRTHWATPKHRPRQTMSDADLSAKLLSIAQRHPDRHSASYIAEAAVRLAVEAEDMGEPTDHGAWSWTDSYNAAAVRVDAWNADAEQARTERTRPHPMFGSAPAAYGDDR